MLWAIVKLQREGFHCWPEAPQAVAFLRNPHRHMFYFEVWIEQRHDDRDIEYIGFKHYMDKLAQDILRDLGDSKSCEMIARSMKEQIEKTYLDRHVKVKVLEDNENGAMVDDTEAPNDN